MVSVLAIGPSGVLAADRPIKILSASAPLVSTFTINSMTYDRVSGTATVSVTPNCYWDTIYASYPGGEDVTFLTGVGAADFAATQRGERTYVFVVGGACEAPATLTIEGLAPGVATLDIGVLLWAQHADYRQISYQVVLR
jgi:hypothetical protein